jgi:hypothetical protein
MNPKKSSRRRFLKGGAALVGASGPLQPARSVRVPHTCVHVWDFTSFPWLPAKLFPAADFIPAHQRSLT